MSRQVISEEDVFYGNQRETWKQKLVVK